MATLKEVDKRYRKRLGIRIGTLPFITHGKRVLCLGARGGGEVEAFIDFGCFAVGIDLAPATDSYVLRGDFNNIQFADSSVDVVFSNALDHANPIEKMVEETSRVLCSRGYFIVETIRDDNDNSKDRWASCWWKDHWDIITLFENSGYSLINEINSDNDFYQYMLSFQKNV